VVIFFIFIHINNTKEELTREVLRVILAINRPTSLLYRRDMKQEEKNALAREKILGAALEEYSTHGYNSSSLNKIWALKGLSKGVVYHYYKDKDEIYIICVKRCFDALTDYLSRIVDKLTGSVEEQIKAYFDTRMQFFEENPQYNGLFFDVIVNPPIHLKEKIDQCRYSFDQLNIKVLSGLLKKEPLRDGLNQSLTIEDVRLFLDFFNLRFKMENQKRDVALKEHEDMCHRELDILFYGVLKRDHE